MSTLSVITSVSVKPQAMDEMTYHVKTQDEIQAHCVSPTVFHCLIKIQLLSPTFVITLCCHVLPLLLHISRS